MKRYVLPVIMLMAISIIAMGTVIGASSGVKDQTKVIINSPVNQLTYASGTMQSMAADASVVEIVSLTPVGTSQSQNYRHPGVAEDSKGNRLVIFRGTEGTLYYYVYCPKGGTWSAPAPIAGGDQPALINSMYANIEIDSRDNFHCLWENANGQVYASFRDGVWTTPFRPDKKGRYDMTGAMTVSSTDEVITIDCEVTGSFTKEIYLHRKGKNDATFGTPFNISRDGPGSTQPCLAVDSQDHVWAAWKSDFLHDGLDENLVIYLAEYATDNQDIGDWIMVSPDPGWSFLPQVAVNSEDKVMATFACSTFGSYLSRLYNPATKELGEITPLGIGLVTAPWHTFFSKTVSHGKDFYFVGLTGGRILILLKYNETEARWEQVAQVSDRAAEVMSLYSAYDTMLIAWNSYEEPTGIFLTTVSVDPFAKIKVKSVSNLTVVKTIERGFFHGYTLNALTWTANPDNTEKELTITAHRIYRKSRTEDDTKWEPIGTVTGTIYRYDDRNIPSNSDYVYAVTCVDDQGHESSVY